MGNNEASAEGPRAAFQGSNSRKQLSGSLRQTGVRAELEPAPNRKAESAAGSRGQPRASEHVKVRNPVGILATERSFPRGSKGRDAIRAPAF